MWFKSDGGKLLNYKAVHLSISRGALTHIHLVRVELYTVTPQPVIVPSLGVKIEPTQTIELLN